MMSVTIALVVMRTRIVVGAALVASFVSTSTPAYSAQTLTKAQAYRSARTCLLNHGASVVQRRTNGVGGFARLQRGSVLWTYKMSLGQVSSVTVRFGGVPSPTIAQRRTVRRCLTKGI